LRTPGSWNNFANLLRKIDESISDSPAIPPLDCMISRVTIRRLRRTRRLFVADLREAGENRGTEKGMD
jgi:hypothetical protein